MKLIRQKSNPGSAIQRFGRWQNGEPQVLIDNQTWLSYGKPDEVFVEFDQHEIKGLRAAADNWRTLYEKEKNRSIDTWEDEGGR